MERSDRSTLLEPRIQNASIELTVILQLARPYANTLQGNLVAWLSNEDQCAPLD